MRSTSRPVRRIRRGFNLVELLIALAITAALLTATIVALNASFMAYQATTEVASTHAIGRLTMHRITSLIRVGQDFEPKPVNPLDTDPVTSDYIEFRHPSGEVITLRWDQTTEELKVAIDGAATEHVLLHGVKAQYDEDGDRIKPFTLVFEKGTKLHRATVDLLVHPDDEVELDLEGSTAEEMRLVASAMPRTAAFE